MSSSSQVALSQAAARQPTTLLLSELDPVKKRVAVCVRVSRMWDYYKDDKLGHVDLVLIDEEGNKMYGEIASFHAAKYKELLHEGDVYVLRDFFVQSSKNLFRAVEGKFMMKFTPWTKVEPKTDFHPDFPRYAYSLTDFALLPRLVGKKDSFIDVIGILTAISDLLHVRLPGQSIDSLKRNLQLMDMDGKTIDVALWGPHAENFDARALYETAQSKAIIILLVGTLIKNYLSRDTIACGDAAKIYINPNIPEKTVYCDRLGKQLPLVQWMQAEDDRYRTAYKRSAPETVKIEYLLSTDPNDFIGRDMISTVTMMRLSSNSWWFLACSGCHKTAYPARNEFICSDPKCLCIAAGPRYKVHLMGGDETGEVEFILFAGVAEQVIGKKIDVVTRAAARRPNVVPAEITALVSQKYTFNYSLNERGLEYGDISFQVNSVLAIHPKSNVFQFNALVSASKEQNVASANAPVTETENVIVPDTTLSEPILSTNKVDDDGPLALSDTASLIEPIQTGKSPSDAPEVSQTPQSACKEVISSALDAHSVAGKRPLKRAATESKQKTIAKKLFKED